MKKRFLISRKSKNRASLPSPKLQACRAPATGALFHRLAENANDILFRMGLQPALRVEYLNPAFTRVTGFSIDDVRDLLKSPDTLIDGIEQTYLMRLWRSGEIEGHPHMLRVRAKDNQMLWLETSLSLIRSETSRVIAVEGIARNITRQWLAEQAVRNIEDRMWQITSHMLDLICQVDAQACFEYLSPSFTRVLGYTPSELMGCCLLDFIHKDDLEKAIHAINQAEDSAQPVSMELRFHHIDGRWIWMESEARPIHDENGKISGWIIASRDILRRRQAQDELHSEKLFLQNVFQSVQDGIAVIDRDLNIQRSNPTFERWFAHSAPLIGKKCYQVFHQRSQICENCACMQVLKTGETSNEVVPFENAQGELIGWLDLFSFPLVDPDNDEVRGAIIYIRDITERGTHEQEMQAIASIASALQAAVTRAEMYPILLTQVETLLNTQACAMVVLPYPAETGGMAVVEAASGLWKRLVGIRYPTGLAERSILLSSNQPYLQNDLTDLEKVDGMPVQGLQAIAGVPLSTGPEQNPQRSVIGTLWIGRKAPIGAVEMRSLSAIGSMVANALQRALLYEQARRYAEQMVTVSRTIHTLVTVITQEEIFARLANAVNELLPDVNAVVIGLYGTEDRPVRWVYALENGKALALDAVPDLLRKQAGSGNWPLLLDSARIYSGGIPSPQPAVYVPLATKKEVLGELQAYRKEKRSFSATDQEMLSILANTAAVALQNTRLVEGLQLSHTRLVHAYDATLESLARALELRDRETEGHTRRVADLSARMAIKVGVEGETLADLRRGAQLHDIGKMGVPDGILLKEHPLNKEEWAIMRKHTEYAMDILAPIDYLKGALDIPHYHHEKWDGTGYPQGMKGEEIPLMARIFSIVDVWDALTSHRPYRKAWSKKRVVRYMAQQSSKHFDPRLLEIFLEMIQEEPFENEEDVDDLEVN